MPVLRTRREFLRDTAVLGAGAALPLAGARVLRLSPVSEDLLRIGLVLPETGSASGAAESAALGAALGATEADRLAGLLGRRVELVEARAADAAAAGVAGRRLAEDGALALVGGFGAEACEALAEAAEVAEVPFLNVGSEADALRARCRPHTFHVEASFAMYADAVAAWALAREGLGRWHFVAGASKTGDAALQRARRALLACGGEDAGTTRLDGEDPAPALEAARRAGAGLAFLTVRGPARGAFLARYAAEPPPFEIAGAPGGAAWLRSLPAAARIGVWPTLWHHRLFKYGAEQLDARFREEHGRPLDDPAWAGWMAVKAVAETALRAGSTDGSGLAGRLGSRGVQFDGHKGRQLSFRPWDHQLRQPLYLVRGVPGAEDAWRSFRAEAELPPGEPGGGLSTAEFLDRLGDTAAPRPCDDRRAHHGTKGGRDGRNAESG